MNINNPIWTYNKSYDLKSLKKLYKAIYGHYPPSFRTVNKKQEQYKQAQKEANIKMAPYRAVKKEFDNFDVLCRFHGVPK